MLILELAVVYSMSGAINPNERNRRCLIHAAGGASPPRVRDTCAESEAASLQEAAGRQVIVRGSATPSRPFMTTRPAVSVTTDLFAPLRGAGDTSSDIPAELADLLDAVLSTRTSTAAIDHHGWAERMARSLTDHSD